MSLNENWRPDEWEHPKKHFKYHDIKVPLELASKHGMIMYEAGATNMLKALAEHAKAIDNNEYFVKLPNGVMFRRLYLPEI